LNSVTAARGRGRSAGKAGNGQRIPGNIGNYLRLAGTVMVQGDVVCVCVGGGDCKHAHLHPGHTVGR